MKHAISWFEIPVTDFDRARSFYETVTNSQMQDMQAMGMQSAFFEADIENGGIGECIIKGDGYQPSTSGPVVYLNGGDDLNVVLKRVEPAGGKVLLTKTPIGNNGFMAFFADTEGNKIGLHSWK